MYWTQPACVRPPKNWILNATSRCRATSVQILILNRFATTVVHQSNWVPRNVELLLAIALNTHMCYVLMCAGLRLSSTAFFMLFLVVIGLPNQSRAVRTKFQFRTCVRQNPVTAQLAHISNRLYKCFISRLRFTYARVCVFFMSFIWHLGERLHSISCVWCECTVYVGGHIRLAWLGSLQNTCRAIRVLPRIAAAAAAAAEQLQLISRPVQETQQHRQHIHSRKTYTQYVIFE